MKRKFIRPLWQRTVAMTMAMLLLAGTAYSEGLTSRASATDLWEETAESSDQGTHDLENSLFDHDSDSGLGLSGDEDGTDESEDLFGSETEDLFESESHEESDPVVSASAEDIEVSVTGSSEIMDEIETVSIQEMGEDRVAAWQEMFDAMDEGDTKCIVSAVYDITLTDRQGNETEPKGDVTVSLTGEKVAEGITDRMDLQVYHDIEKGSDKPVSEDAVEEMAVYEEGMDTVVFDTNSFSEYALVLTGKSTQQEVSFSQNEYLELDKYIEETGGPDINGQKTYDIYLEQAYYKPESDIKMPNAPLRSDFFLIMDHSASMSDYPVVRLNQAVDKLLREIQARNNMRVKRAAEGKYKNINPSSVVAKFLPDGKYRLKDPATVKDAMRDHLIYLTGAITYNNHVDIKVRPDQKVAIYTDADRQDLLDISSWVAAKMPVKKTNDKNMYGSGKLLGWPDYGAGDKCLRPMTRTDLATKQIRDWIMENQRAYTVTAPDGKNYCTARVILATDGAPAGYGGPPDGYYNNDPYDYINGGGRGAYMYRGVCPWNANAALDYSNKIKNLPGARVYVSYVNVDSDPDAGTILLNLERQNVNKAVLLDVVWHEIANRPGQPSLTATFMMLYSQCATNSSYNVSDDGSSFNSYSADPNSFGYTSAYFKYHENADDIPKIEEFVEHDDQVSQQDAFDGSGYASVSSYVLDEITDPFEIRSITDIKVYAVPRIPTNLDGNTKIPRNMIGEPGENGATIYRVREEDFRWGDINLEKERVDVTDEVTIEVVGNRVKISGYDYEANAVSDYDKDQFGQWTIPAWGDPTVYKTGDYGYKLVVVIPINAKFSFGGNGIKTNNTDISGFYPSVPTRKDLPKWEDNTQLNDKGNAYIKLYPEVKVDLEVSYNIVSDNAIIYAPQTQKLHDLVTNSNNSIWFSDKGYHNALTDRNNAKAAFDRAENDLKSSNQNQPRQPGLDYDAWIRANGLLVAAKNAAAIALQEAQAELDKVHAYIPDGLNNAFVNIEYKLIDPKGTTVGTLTIPHGTAYFINGQTKKGNIDWTFTEGPNAQIKHSGEYKVEATVTPVDTERSPSWHVYTEADSQTIQGMLKYKSTSYSPTGSSRLGPHVPITYEKKATAKIFQLKIVAKDSRQGRNEVVDFADFEGELKERNVSLYDTHIVSYEWVCIDSKFTSDRNNEPGSDHVDTDTSKVGTGGVNFTATVPQGAFSDELVQKDSNKITARDGAYVPAAMLLTRRIGNLNKDAGATPTFNLAVMSDSDNKYGPGVHSVIWEHKCDIIDDCDNNDFAQARKYHGADANVGDPGKVRFLVHVVDNPNVVPSKTTTTPAIITRGDIKWEVSAVNDNSTENPNKRDSEFSLWDILPHNGDGRHDPFTNYDGSETGTDLYYRSVQVDYSKSAKARDYLKKAQDNGEELFYYTRNTAVRDAEDEQIYDKDDPIQWVPLKEASIKNNVYSYAVPDDAVAIRVDTLLGWEEGIIINMTANVKNPAGQRIGDHYHNVARTYNGKSGRESNVVSTQVTKLFVAGTVWVDEDNNGIMTAEEPRKDRIKVSLYQPYNENNPLDYASLRTINNIQLVAAYDNTNHCQYPPVHTDASGTFLFDDVQPGLYYIVADCIPDEYQITDKKRGETEDGKRTLDSEAEPNFVTSREQKYSDDGKTAWIKQIRVTDESKVAQNIGLKNIRGSVRVGKTLDEIYFPSNMTDEERAAYNVPFVFTLKHTGKGRTYTKQVFLNEDNMRSIGGQPQVWAEFTDLPLGTYELTETHDAQYKILDMKGNSDRVTFNAGRQKATIEIRHDEYEYTVVVKNGLDRDPPGGDENGVVNRINVRTPVRLEIQYSGPDVIRDHRLAEYTFKKSDFDDMIVTYDDGTRISLSEGSLRFDQVKLIPGTVTNMMNTNQGRPYTIRGYYAERGHLVSDFFRVGVDLMPVHKFHINFDANGSSFDDGNGGTTTTNTVHFIYDEHQRKNLVVSGTYKDANIGGLNVPSDWIFAGWNTRSDGAGDYYGTEDNPLTSNALDALNAFGMDKSYSGGTLYADWKVKVTFDAGKGGTTTGAMTHIIQGDVGDQVLITSRSLNSKVPEISLWALKPGSKTESKPGYEFFMWNTKADGTGKSIQQYNAEGGVKGPVTFYAIYYQTDYFFTGNVQTFRAPVTGWYKCYLWGAKGGDDRFRGGNGGYTYGEIELTKGQELYVYVGDRGETNASGGGSGYNGGGKSGPAGGSGAGGGATDIRTHRSDDPKNWRDTLDSRILVAGGGGGGGFYSGGGVGGGSAGGDGLRGGLGEIVNPPAWDSHPKDQDAAGKGGFEGGTQDRPGRGGALGVGASAWNDGGGGGGGYCGGGACQEQPGMQSGAASPDTDFGGGGGSSYVGTRAEQDLGIKVKEGAYTRAGDEDMPTPFDEGTLMRGNADPCYARIILKR